MTDMSVLLVKAPLTEQSAVEDFLRSTPGVSEVRQYQQFNLKLSENADIDEIRRHLRGCHVGEVLEDIISMNSEDEGEQDESDPLADSPDGLIEPPPEDERKIAVMEKYNAVTAEHEINSETEEEILTLKDAEGKVIISGSYEQLLSAKEPVENDEDEDGVDDELEARMNVVLEAFGGKELKAVDTTGNGATVFEVITGGDSENIRGTLLELEKLAGAKDEAESA